MPTTTIGHVSVTPIRIETSASLLELRDAARKARYKGPAPAEGWGSVHEADELVGRSLRGRPKESGETELLGESDFHPEQFRARLFWDEVDRKALSIFGESGDANLLNVFQATDVTLSQTHEDGVLLGLLGLRTEAQIKNNVLPALRRLLLSVDEDAMIYADSSPVDFGDDDFFLWLLYRYHHSPVVTNDTVLTSVRSINSQDVYYRGATINQGADLDRPELLALIGGATTRFGPAKLTLVDSILSLELDMELRADGGFSAFVGRSSYDPELDRAAKGLQLVQDIAYKVIPGLKEAYDADGAWRSSDRAAFLAEARGQLVASLLPQGCPHCAQPIP